MAHAHADFSGQTNGDFPTGWTARWAPGTDSIEIINNTGPNGDKPGVRLNQDWIGEYHLYSFDAADALANREDFEILALWSPQANQANISYHFAGRGSGDIVDSTNSHMAVDFYGTTARTLTTNNDVFASTNHTITQLVANEWYWIRFRVNGSTQSGKIWPYGDAEPGTWGFTDTRSTPSAAGWIGLGGWSGPDDCVVEFHVATGGETAFVPTSGFASVVLLPDGFVSASGIVDQAAGSTNLHLAVDEAWASTDNDTTYLVNSASADGNAVLTLSNTPSDFDSMNSITIKLRARKE